MNRESLPGSVGKGIDGGHPCISHAHWRPLPPRCCLLGEEALALLSEVCVDFWRHAGWFEVAFLSLPLPGRRSRAHRAIPICDAIACPKTDVDLCIPPRA